MTPEISTEQDSIIVLLPRRFDVDSAPSVEKELKPIIGQHPERVLFDFTKTEYISSAGMRVLLGSFHLIKDGGGSVALCSLCRQVMYVFEIAGFTKIFTLYENKEKALRHMKRKD